MRIQGRAMLFVGFMAATLALLQFSARALVAAGAKGGEIAVVDIAELQKGYNTFKDDFAAFQRFQEEKGKIYEIRQGLTATEWQELDDLEGKKSRKPDEEKRLQELRGMTELRKKALRELQSKPDLSDKDKEELKRLNDIPRANQVRLEELQERLMGDIQKEQQRLFDKNRKAMMEAYDKLAKDKGFSIVLDKSQLQWSASGVDITQDVLTKLNKK